MKLVYKYDSKDKIPEGLESYYKEIDGAWYLQLEGAKTQEDVDRAMAAMEKQKQLRIDAEKDLAKYKDVDLEKWEEVKDYDPSKKTPEGEDFDKAVRDAVRAKQEELEEKANEKVVKAEQAKTEAEQKARNYVKESWKRKILAEKFGFTDPRRLNDFLRALNDESDPDFASLRRTVESIEVVEENGSYQVVGGDLKDDKGAKEVLEKVAKSDVAKHYIPADGNHGGGSDNNGEKKPGSQGNPYKKETWNLTEQAKLESESPEEAKRLANAAGVPIDA